MIRAGDYHDTATYDEYAKFMWSGELEALYPLPGAYSRRWQARDADEAEYIKNYTAFWGELREQIVADPPDYLLGGHPDRLLPIVGGHCRRVPNGTRRPRGVACRPVCLRRRRLRGISARNPHVRAPDGQEHLDESPIRRRTWIVRRVQALAQSVEKAQAEPSTSSGLPTTPTRSIGQARLTATLKSDQTPRWSSRVSASRPRTDP